MGSGAFLVAVCRFLAELLVRAWHAHKCVPKNIPPDEDEILYARRLIAQRCLYGVDKNPMAVDLAKLSLWLATLAKDHPFTFLDHALRDGDSLVGLTKAQILGFHWKPDKQRDFARSAIEGQLNRALEQRRQIREAPEGTSDALLRERLLAADGFINPGRRYGDLVVSAFFAADNDRKRKERIELLAADLAAQQSQFEVERHNRLDAALRDLRNGTHPVHPFHWEVEFPEVFDRENPGFDAFVGNPPFLRGKSVSTNFGDLYRDWLAELHTDSNSSADISAHFVRRTFLLVRQLGTLGLVATNSISQGYTRAVGLRWICQQTGCIYAAKRRLKWPGTAAVTVSVVHIVRGPCACTAFLDGEPVKRISAFLLDSRRDDDPAPLVWNKLRNRQGPNVLGTGFMFDDSDAEGTSISEMKRLISKNSLYSNYIYLVICRDEVNSSPTLAHHRYVIDLGELSEEEAWVSCPELMKIVEEKDSKPLRCPARRIRRLGRRLLVEIRWIGFGVEGIYART